MFQQESTLVFSVYVEDYGRVLFFLSQILWPRTTSAGDFPEETGLRGQWICENYFEYRALFLNPALVKFGG